MTLPRVICAIVCTLVLLAGVGACKDEAPKHPAEQRAAEFLDALKYGDASQAAALHLESTSSGFYCQSDRFAQVLEMARAKRSEKECARLEKAGDEPLDSLTEEARLLVQIVRFSCEQPEGDCADYGERVLQSHLAQKLETPGSRWRGGNWAIQKVMGGEDEAIVYVDLDAAQGHEASYETLTMKRLADRWYVAESFVDEKHLLPE